MQVYKAGIGLKNVLKCFLLSLHNAREESDLTLALLSEKEAFLCVRVIDAIIATHPAKKLLISGLRLQVLPGGDLEKLLNDELSALGWRFEGQEDGKILVVRRELKGSTLKRLTPVLHTVVPRARFKCEVTGNAKAIIQKELPKASPNDPKTVKEMVALIQKRIDARNPKTADAVFNAYRIEMRDAHRQFAHLADREEGMILVRSFSKAVREAIRNRYIPRLSAKRSFQASKELVERAVKIHVQDCQPEPTSRGDFERLQEAADQVLRDLGLS